ncbi:hypothetical protein L228DRAFT_265319 [Xylona heveae TC161]|uniref:Uncharacterized protein n=1 Tax=Xylona heveae (strain CBS 132557 / TC161) TaxID=1328760 RepID=A0A165K4F7_XYLHT|nr:hypothetical protein L228DRAFT_265319 [Xylona heveae TC161]KZF26971.1 hypothetical protein L228DRAFT_265319 [Xylona heveae TC161]
MPALDHSLVVRDQFHQLFKRKNWAAHHPGVVLVFCIVFIVGAGVIGLVVYRKVLAARARRQARTKTGLMVLLAMVRPVYTSTTFAIHEL